MIIIIILITLVLFRFVRTLAKPVANKMKKEAANHPLFSSACVYCGQKIHYFSSRANVLALGYFILTLFIYLFIFLYFYLFIFLLN